MADENSLFLFEHLARKFLAFPQFVPEHLAHHLLSQIASFSPLLIIANEKLFFKFEIRFRQSIQIMMLIFVI